MPSYLTDLVLMTLNVVHFSGGINAVASLNIQSSCLQAIKSGASRIRLNIASEGGSTLYGFAIYSFLKSLPVPVDTHNLGGVNSMANVVFLAGEYRTASPYARFLLHPMSWTFNAGSIDHSRLRENSQCLDDDLERFARIYEATTTAASNPLDIRGVLSGDTRILDPQAALDAGIISQIVDPAFSPGDGLWWASA